MRLSFFYAFGRRATEAVMTSFAPRPTASSRQIRLNGVYCAAIGLLVLALTIAAFMLHPVSAALGMLPAFLAYSFLIVGTYRALLGKTPAPKYPGEVSLTRILFGVATLVFLFGTLFGLLKLLSIFFPDL